MKRKQLFSLLLALCLLLSFLPAHAATIADSGYCGGEGDGSNLTWTLNSDGMLTISGTGMMNEKWTGTYHAPWCNGKYGGNDFLKSVKINNGVTSIGGFAFSTRSKLASVSIPNSVTSIGRQAFGDCWALKNVIIPNSVTSIGDSAFDDCCSLTSMTIPDSVTSIGKSLFYECSSLTSVTIPNSITSITTCMFFGCKALTSVTIPSKVTTIGISAFSGCSGMTSVTIPKTVTSIMRSAFDSCRGLKDVYYGGSESDWNKIEIGSWNSCLTDATIHYNSYNSSDPVKKTYTVTYNANGGTGAPASQQKTQGVDLKLRSDIPTKTCKITYNANGGTVSPASKTVNATFFKWNTKKDGSGVSCGTNETYKSDANLTLYAQWTDPQAGSLATPTRGGYTFDGWYTASSGGTKVTSTTVVSGNITIYAHWTKVSTYTVTYDANGGTGAPASQQKTQGVDLKLRSDIPTKKYKISFNANGGTVSPASKTVNATFVKWNTKKDGSGVSCGTNATYKSDANLTLYAQWTDPTVGELPVPTRNGGFFSGWYTAASGGEKVTSSTTVSKDVTFYAHWSKCSHVWEFKKETTRLICNKCGEYYDVSPKLGFQYGRDNFSFDHADVGLNTWQYAVSEVGMNLMNPLLRIDVFAAVGNVCTQASSFWHNIKEKCFLKYGFWGGSCYGLATMNSYFKSGLSPEKYGQKSVSDLSVKKAELIGLNQDTKLRDSINIMMYAQLSIRNFVFDGSKYSFHRYKDLVDCAKSLSAKDYPPNVTFDDHTVSVIGILPEDANDSYYMISIYDCNYPDEPRFIFVSKNFNHAYVYDIEELNKGKDDDKDIEIKSIKTSSFMNNIDFWAPGLSSSPLYSVGSSSSQKKSAAQKAPSAENYDEIVKNYDMFMLAADGSVSIKGNDGSHFTYKEFEVTDSSIENVYCEYLADFGLTKIIVPHSAESYEVESQEQYAVSFNSKETISTAYFEKGGKAVFNCKGTVSADTSKTRSYHELAAYKYDLIGDSDVLGMSANGTAANTKIDYSNNRPIIKSDDWEKTEIQIQHDNQDFSTEKLQVQNPKDTSAVTLYESNADKNVITVKTVTIQELPGDVSGDGEVTAEDARLALRAAVGLETFAAGSAQFLAADATKDGAITAEDARLILRAAVGLETLS